MECIRSCDKVQVSSSIRWMYANLEWGDLWHDAAASEAVRYLRGSRKICIPQEWRAVLPTELLD